VQAPALSAQQPRTGGASVGILALRGVTEQAAVRAAVRSGAATKMQPAQLAAARSHHTATHPARAAAPMTPAMMRATRWRTQRSVALAAAPGAAMALLAPCRCAACACALWYTGLLLSVVAYTLGNACSALAAGDAAGGRTHAH
jgi:hypothetical protein